MRSRTANVESLEARQFFSVTPVTGLAERATAAVAPAAVVQTLKKTKAPRIYSVHLNPAPQPEGQ